MLRYLLPNPASSPPRCVKDGCSFHAVTLKGKAQLGLQRQSYLRPPVFIFLIPVPVYGSVCSALTGAAWGGGRTRNLWVIGRTASSHFSAVIQFAKELFRQKKKVKQKKKTKTQHWNHCMSYVWWCFCFCVRHASPREWEVNLRPPVGQRRKFPALFLVVVTCDSSFVLSLLFQHKWVHVFNAFQWLVLIRIG